MELRCDNKLHGIVDGDIVEVRCDSRWCGKRPDNVVIHRFNTKTGEVETTRQFKNLRKDIQDA